MNINEKLLMIQSFFNNLDCYFTDTNNKNKIKKRINVQ